MSESTNFPITILGDESLGGTYLLRLLAREGLAVRFGRFRGGEPITIPAGECLYVGSAMRGVGVRVLRHAGRVDGATPQPIRAALWERFLAAGLVKGKQRPSPPKRLHWHIDYLLERPEAVLTHVIVLRSRVRLETAVAHWLAQQPETCILAPGLGARDAPGSTHLLGVRTDEAWWQALPHQLLLLDEAAKSAHNSLDKQ